MSFLDVSLVENFYIVTSLITGAGSLALGCFVYFQNRAKTLNSYYAVISLFIGAWSLSLFFCHISPIPESALFWNRLVHLFASFIPLSFFRFTLEMVGFTRERRILLAVAVAGSVFLAIFASTPYLVSAMQPKFDFHVWPVPGPLYLAFVTFFGAFNYYSLWLLFQAYRKAEGLRRDQMKFIFVGFLIAVVGGTTNFGYFYNIPFPPIGSLFIFMYLVFLAYAIIKYRLMDVTVAITRIGIFVFVYSLLLGAPIVGGVKTLGTGPWLWPVSLMAVFATAAPFVYFYFQRKAEARILYEQRQYQHTLRQASAGMGRIRDLKKLLNLIVFVLTRAVRMEHAFIYLFDPTTEKFNIHASRRSTTGPDLVVRELSFASPLVKRLMADPEPLVFEEIRQRFADTRDEELSALVTELSDLKAALAFPIFIRTDLTAIVIMGRKDKGRAYNEDDLAVFSILANQAALAIENARFYEDVRRTQEQLFQAEKMATVGTMADGLSHQINNRFHALGFIAGDALDTIRLAKQKQPAPETAEILNELERAFTRVEDNVAQGGEIVRGLLRYTRKGDEGMSPVELPAVFKAAYEMAQFKIKASDLSVVHEYPADLPKIKGNFTQLQEVFFNMIDNGYDAMRQRRDELHEEGFTPTLTLTAKVDGNSLIITLQDNGIGVKPEDQHKLFTPFFTTKLSSKKGTGLGLYVIKKIIEDNHGGTLELSSVYKVGTRFSLRLPVYPAEKA